MDAVRRLLASHARLKKRIHETRIPLPKWGQRVMGFVYFCIPLAVGKLVFDWVSSVQEQRWGVDPVTKKLRTPEEVHARARDKELEENAEKARAAVQFVLDHRKGELPR